ncbi:hypothetical protein Tco_1217312 [Tanacetum coccineum]
MTSPYRLNFTEVNDDIFDSGEEIIKNLATCLDKTKDLPPYHDNQLSGNPTPISEPVTKSSSSSPTLRLIEEMNNCDSVFDEDFSKVDAWSSTNNEDKVFNPGILIHENLFEVTNCATMEKNVKKTTNASLILEDFNPTLYELPFYKENYLIGALKLSKSLKFLKARWRSFLDLTKRTSESWMLRVSTSIPFDKLKYGGLGQAK